MLGLRFVSPGGGGGGRLNKNVEQLTRCYDYLFDGSNEKGLPTAGFANLVGSVL
jgi:hypothetical protein